MDLPIAFSMVRVAFPELARFSWLLVRFVLAGAAYYLMEFILYFRNAGRPEPAQPPGRGGVSIGHGRRRGGAGAPTLLSGTSSLCADSDGPRSLDPLGLLVPSSLWSNLVTIMFPPVWKGQGLSFCPLTRQVREPSQAEVILTPDIDLRGEA